MPVQRRRDRPKDFSHGLQKLRFACIPPLDGLEDLVYVCCCVCYCAHVKLLLLSTKTAEALLIEPRPDRSASSPCRLPPSHLSISCRSEEHTSELQSLRHLV